MSVRGQSVGHRPTARVVLPDEAAQHLRERGQRGTRHHILTLPAQPQPHWTARSSAASIPRDAEAASPASTFAQTTAPPASAGSHTSPFGHGAALVFATVGTVRTSRRATAAAWGLCLSLAVVACMPDGDGDGLTGRLVVPDDTGQPPSPITWGSIVVLPGVVADEVWPDWNPEDDPRLLLGELYETLTVEDLEKYGAIRGNLNSDGRFTLLDTPAGPALLCQLREAPEEGPFPVTGCAELDLPESGSGSLYVTQYLLGLEAWVVD